MDSNPLDALIEQAQHYADYYCFTADHPMRALLAVVKAARKECREHRASVVASTIRSAMNQVAEVPPCG